jgi:hypothetical protein
MTLYTKTRRSSKHLRNKSRTRAMKGGMKMRVKHKNGAIYEGDIKDGKANGHGTTKWTDGAVYVGKYKNDLWHGRGKMKWANGEVYEGSFMNGLRHGKGKTTYPNGEFYEGDYRDGLKHGIGTYQWADGSVYVGEWIDDNINGRGKWRDENGVVYEGNLKEGGINSLSLLLQDGNVSNLVFHPTEPLLLAVCRGKTHKEPQKLFLQRFNRNTGHIIHTIHIAHSMLDTPGRSIAFHPRAPIFAVGNIKGEVDLFRWEINEGLGVGLSANKMSTTKIDPENREFRRQCEIIAFHPHEPLFATCGETDYGIYTTRIWRIERANAASPFQLVDLQCEMMSNEISSIAFHPSQPILIAASTMKFCLPENIVVENHVKLWNYFDVNNPRLITILSRRPEEEFSIIHAFNSDHRSFHTDFVNFVVFHPTEPFFATASKDATIKMWRMTPNPDDSLYATCVATFRSDDNACPVTCVAFHPKAPLLVGGFYNGNAVVWEYMLLLSKKVLTLDTVMYEPRVLSVFPLPPPMLHRMRMTPAMLTEAKGKLRRRSDREPDVAMMKKTPRVPFSTSGVKEESDSSPSPPARKSLSRAELNRREREIQERRRELVDSSRVFVSAVNFQVDSRGVSFLEIGRNNTNVVELRNVSHLVSEAKNKESVRKEQFSSRKEAVEKFADMFKLSTRPNRRLFTAKEVHDAILRQPVRLMGVPPKVEEDEDWEETLKMREQGSKEGSKGGYKSRHKNVTRRLRKSRR